MPDAFVPLAVWVSSLQIPEPALPATTVVSDPPPEDWMSRVRRLRAAVLEALDEPGDREALGRVRSFADALVAEDP